MDPDHANLLLHMQLNTVLNICTTSVFIVFLINLLAPYCKRCWFNTSRRHKSPTVLCQKGCLLYKSAKSYMWSYLLWWSCIYFIKLTCFWCFGCWKAVNFPTFGINKVFLFISNSDRRQEGGGREWRWWTANGLRGKQTQLCAFLLVVSLSHTLRLSSVRGLSWDPDQRHALTGIWTLNLQ